MGNGKCNAFCEPLADDYDLRHFGPPVKGTPSLRLCIDLTDIEDDGDDYGFCYHVENRSELPAYPQIAKVFFPVGKRHGIHRVDTDGWERALLADTFCLFWTEDPANMRPPSYGNILLTLYSHTDQRQSGFAVPYSRYGLSYDPILLDLPAMLQFDDSELQDRPELILDASTSGAAERDRAAQLEEGTDEEVTCAGCGRLVSEDSVEEWESGLYCPECFGYCHECLEEYPKSELVLLNGNYWCRECASKDRADSRNLRSTPEET